MLRVVQMSNDDEFSSVNCCECGIVFKFTKKIEEMWRESGKNFYCPNGHSLHWSKPIESKEQKEIKALKKEVQELNSKLSKATSDLEVQKKRADELAAELEIWRPSSAEKAS